MNEQAKPFWEGSGFRLTSDQTAFLRYDFP